MRKRKDQEEYKVFNGGGVGYSQAALDALARGNYGKQTGRKVQYNTSQEQTQQAKSLPVLEGISRSNNVAPVNNSNNRKSYIDTDRARRKYAEKNPSDKLLLTDRERELVHEALSAHNSRKEDGSFDDKAIKNAARQLRMDGSDKSYWDTSEYDKNDWVKKKYGISSDELVRQYSKDWDKVEERKNRDYAADHSILSTIGTVLNNAIVKPTVGMMAQAENLIDPNAKNGNLARSSARSVSNKSNYQRDEITKNMSGVGKTVYDVGTNVADRVVGTALAGKAAPVLTAFRTAEDARESLEDRGIKGRKTTGESLAMGGIDAALDVVGLEKIKGLKSLQQSSKLGKALAGSAAIGGGEQFITSIFNEAIDRIFNKDSSVYATNVQHYMNQGLSEDDAKDQALLDTAKQVAQETGQGALFGSIMGVGGKAAKSVIKKIPEVVGNVKNKRLDNTLAKNSDIQNIINGTGITEIDNATRQAANAADEINRLSNQIPSVSGKATTIKSSYDGVKPIQSAPNNVRVEVPIEHVNNAAQNIQTAIEGGKAEGKSYKTILGQIYNKMFDSRKITSFDVPVKNLSIDGEDYNVTVNKNVISKVISDKNLSPEKIAILDNLESVIQNSDYVDSGKYVPHGNKVKNVTRYDYFETPVKIGDNDYIVSFDVEVVPGSNKYKTHKVINEINLSEVGKVSTNTDIESAVSPTEMRDLSNQNVPLVEGNVNDRQSKMADLERQMNEKIKQFDEEVKAEKNKVLNEGRKQNPRSVKKLEGAELEEAQKKVEFNKREINGLEQKKQAIVNGKGNKRNGKLTKAAKSEVKAIDDQINKLKSENKPIQRQIDGKPTPIKELMTDDEREAIFSEQNGIYKDLNYAVKFAGSSDEAKALRKEAKALLNKYVESNDTADLREFYNKVIELDNLAKEVDSEYVTGSGIRNTYDDYFDSQGERDIPHVVKKIMATSALQAVPDAHRRLNSEAISAPVEPVTENLTSTKTDETMTPVMRNKENVDALNSIKSQLSNPEFKPITFHAGKKDFIIFKSTRTGEKWQLSHISDTGEFTGHSSFSDDNGLLKALAEAKSKIENIDTSGHSNIFNKPTVTLGEMLANPDQYSYEDFGRALRTWDRNANPEDLELEDIIYGLSEAVKDDPGMADMEINMPSRTSATEVPTETMPETPVEEVPTEPIQETPVDNGGNVPPNEPPLVTDSEDTDNMGRSRVVKHTGINSGVVDAYEYENDPVIQEIATYAKHSNEKTFNNALENVRKNGTKLLDEYNSDRRSIDNDQDVDQAMLLLRNLKEQIRNATPEEAEVLTVQKNMLLSRLRETGTKYGQAIQAFAKWNDTSEGALINGDGFLRDATDAWKSQNQEQVKTNEDIAEALDDIGREGKVPDATDEKKPESQRLKNALNSLVEENTKPEKQELSREELRERVKNTLDNEAASVAEFSDEDIDYITNLMQNGANKQELAEALNRKMATGRFGVSQDTQTKVNQLFDYADKFDPNSKQAVEAKAAAYKLIADEVVGKASPFEKFEAWRYLAMLGNPKTMLRNFVGNTMFNAVTSASNSLSAVLEAAVDKTSRALGGKGIQRTKSVLIPSLDSKLIKGAWDDAPAKRYKQLTGTKYEKSGVRKSIESQKSVFDNKFLKLYEQAVDKGISDYPAIRTKYSTSLAGWMKANGLDETAFDAESKYYRLKNLSDTRVLTDAERAEMSNLKQTMDALEKGRDYALKQAEYATFHEDNAIADAFSRGSRYLLENENKGARALGYMMEGIVPFKKTPANILRSGVEYSPLGAIKSIADTGKLIYENTGKRKSNLGDTYFKKSFWRGNDKAVNRTLASDVIDSWSKTLTGTGLAMLGYYLKSKGVLNSSESDEKYQDDLEGIQNYSITINGKTYTLDWAAPAIMPLLLGAEVKKINDKNAIPDEKWYSNPDEIIGSVNALLNPIFETSMLQGIQNVMESAANEIKYNDDGAVGGILGSATMNALTGYATQALPTISGQVARTIDNTRRTTDTASNSNFVSGVEKQVRKLANKVPFLSKYVNTPYYDAYGRSQTNSPSDNPLANLAYQMLSPAYIRDINTTAADTMARNVYNAPDPNDPNGRPIQDKNVFAPWKSKVNVDGVKLTPQEMSTYRQSSGQASYAIRDALNKEQWFNELDGNKQTEVLHKVNTLVDKIGKEATGHPQDSKELTAYNEGGIPALLDKLHDTQLNNMLKEAGVSTSSNLAKEVKADIKAGNEQAALQAIEQSNKLKAEAQNLGFVNKDGKVNTEQYQKVIKQAGAQSDKLINDLPALQTTGLEKSAYYYYAHAINVHPELTPNEFARQYKEINTNTEDKLTQKEMLKYINSYQFSDDPAEDQAMVLDLWNTYNDGSWKKVPYVKKDGTYGAK